MDQDKYAIIAFRVAIEALNYGISKQVAIALKPSQKRP
jgi:hypothetical protein